jgi:hypothetical protein
MRITRVGYASGQVIEGELVVDIGRVPYSLDAHVSGGGHFVARVD